MSNLGLVIYSDNNLRDEEINNLKNLQLFDDSSEELNEIFNEENNKSNLSIELIQKNDNDKKSDSSEDSELDSINLDFTDDTCTYFLSIEKLKTMKFIDIYNIIKKNQILIFIDESKFKLSKNCLSRCMIKRYYLTKNVFPGCVFISYNFKNILLRSLSKLNDRITNQNFIDKKYKNKKNEIYNFICFDEGDILKDIIYKRMEIREKILFIPIDKYNLKITEYKIRGFCQIMEEMGSKSIDINFINNNKKKSFSKCEVKNNINSLVNSLGFNVNDEDENKENRTYNLNFSKINTIILNENHIIRKIKNKEYILSENNYNSNLELQYVISSRCNHYIKKYSTSFTLDSNILIDKKLYSKLEKFKIGLNLNINKLKSENFHFSILTNVIFFDVDDMKDNIFGSCVSFNYNGFNFLVSTLSKDKFKTNGIYKIIDFIEYFCNKSLKKINNKKYKLVKNILDKIKEKFTLKDYANILLNYFDVNSSWIDFEYFLNLLSGETVSYDKLGFLILYENNNNKVNKIVDFIYNSCITKDLNNNNLEYQKKFWLIFHPNNDRLYYFLKNKLDKKYNILKEFNLYNLSKLMYDISIYNIILKEDDNKILFNKLITNMEIGFSYYEFYNNFSNFISRIILKEIIKNHNILLNDYKEILLNSFSYESFIQNRIINYNKLIEYINFKIKKIINLKNIIEKFNKIKDFSITDFIVKLNELKNDNYIYKKINIIFKGDNNLIENYYNDTSYSNKIISSSQEKTSYFFRRLFLYNDKLLALNVPLNYLGFDKLFLKIINGVKSIELNNLYIFGKRIIIRLAEEKFSNDYIKYNNLINFSEKIKKLISKKIIEKNSYYKFCSFIIQKLNEEFDDLNLKITDIKDLY